MNSVAGFISDYENACEADIDEKLAHADRQRYGEIPVVPVEAPRRPWESARGCGDAIAQWKDKFLCLRVVGTSIFPEPKKERSAVQSSVRDGGFWSATCDVAIPEDAYGDEWVSVIDDDEVYGTASVEEQGDPLPEEGFEPDLSLTIQGAPPPTRNELLNEEREEILCQDGVYDDFVALSRYPETLADKFPRGEDEDLFPPFVAVSAEEATEEIRFNHQAALLFEREAAAALEVDGEVT